MRTLADVLAYRDEMVRQQQFLVRVIDSPSTDPVIRVEAQAIFDDLTWRLSMADGPAREVNVLIAFQGYSRLVDETLAELPAEVIDAQPIRVTMVRHAAELSDTARFNDDFRIECGDTVLFLLDKLRQEADDDAHL